MLPESADNHICMVSQNYLVKLVFPNIENLQSKKKANQQQKIRVTCNPARSQQRATSVHPAFDTPFNCWRAASN